MRDKTPFAGLNKVGTYMDEDLPRLNENTDIIDVQLKQAHDERQQEAQARVAGFQAEASARENALADEKAARMEADAALGQGLNTEAQARQQADEELAALLQVESSARAEGDTAMAEGAASALADHDANADAHDALVQRITVGSLSPVIGICLVEAGGGSGLWFNVDAQGQPVSLGRSYFDYHPVYAGLKRVLVDGQIMVEVPRFWVKSFTAASGPFAGKHCRVLSPGQADGFKPFPAFMKDGQPLEKVYIGAYQGTNEGGSPVKIGSRPGKSPIVNLNFPTMQSYCANRNTGGVSGFGMWNMYQVAALEHLVLTEFATPDAQAVIGRGHVDGSAAVNTDYTNQPVWRGFVGLWGNVWQMVDGMDVTTAGKVRLWKNDGSRVFVDTGFVLPAYDGTNPAYMVKLKTGNGAGFDFDDIFLPETTTTSALAGTFPDYFYGRSGSAGNVLYVGGYWSNGGGAGLFCRNLSLPASYSDTYFGCRLAKI